MKKLLKAALVVVAFSGFQAATLTGASAGQSSGHGVDLTKYALDLNVLAPDSRQANSFEPFEVAGRWHRRRNRAIAGGVAVGIAALIISEAIRSERRKRHYYDDDRYYYRDRRYSYPGARTCRIWARRCDNGRISQCRKWNRRCR